MGVRGQGLPLHHRDAGGHERGAQEDHARLRGRAGLHAGRRERRGSLARSGSSEIRAAAPGPLLGARPVRQPGQRRGPHAHHRPRALGADAAAASAPSSTRRARAGCSPASAATSARATRGVRLYAVEPAECALLSRRAWGHHGIEGIGDGFVPAQPRRLAAHRRDHHHHRGERGHRPAPRRARRASSAASRAAATWPPRSSSRAAIPSCRSIVTIINDTGQRYFTTPLCGEAKHVDIPERDHPLDALHRGAARPLPGDLGDPRVTIAAREYDFRAARQRLEAKPKSAGAEAHHARGRGRAACRTATTWPSAAASTRARRWRSCGRCSAAGRAASPSRATSCATRASGAWWRGRSSKLVTSWMGIGLPWGLSRIQREYVESGRVPVRGVEPPRASASATAPPPWACRSCRRSPCSGSDLMDVGGSKTVELPLHRRDAPRGARALPRRGAASTCIAPTASATARSTATRTWTPTSRGPRPPVLVTAEEIVSEDEIRRHPDRTVIPGFAVDALVHVPYGLLPARVLRRSTTPSPTTSASTWTGIQARGVDGGRADYLERYVYAPASSRGLPGALRRGAPRRRGRRARAPGADGDGPSPRTSCSR